MELVNKDCKKLNFDRESIKNNRDYYQKKWEIIDLGKKLSEIAIVYMDIYIE